MLLRTLGTKVEYIKPLALNMLDLKYANVLGKRKINEKEENYQKRVWPKVYIKSLILL